MVTDMEGGEEAKSARFSTSGTWLAWFSTRGMQASIAALTLLFYIPYLAAGWYVSGLLYAGAVALIASSIGKVYLSIDALDPADHHHWLTTPRMKVGYLLLWIFIFFSAMWDQPTDTPIATVVGVGLGASLSALGAAALSKAVVLTAKRKLLSDTQ